MDEEDIAVPSGSLNNRFGVVYEVSQPGTDGWKRLGNLVTAIHNAERYLTCPTGKSRAQCRESLQSYTIRPHQNTRGGNNVEFSWTGGCSVGVEEATSKSS